MVNGIGGGECDVRIPGLETIGRSEQVDLAVFECLDGSFAGWVATDLDGQPQGGAQDPGVVGGKTLVFMAADRQVKRGVVGRRTAQDQFALVEYPLPLWFIQLDVHVACR
ncbi:hypothetical protein D3C75_1078870 [compost metagenome]